MPVIFSITLLGWCSLHIYVPRLQDQHIRISFLQFSQRQMYCWNLYFDVQTLFLVVLGSMGRFSLQYVWYFPLSGISCTSKFIIIHIWVVNQYLSQLFSKICKNIIHLEGIFHFQICNHFSAHYEKEKTRMGYQVIPNALSKPIWGLVPPSCLKALWLSTAPLYL